MTLKSGEVIKVKVHEGASSCGAARTNDENIDSGVLSEKQLDGEVRKVCLHHTKSRKGDLEEDGRRGGRRQEEREIREVGSGAKGAAHCGYVDIARRKVIELPSVYVQR